MFGRDPGQHVVAGQQQVPRSRRRSTGGRASARASRPPAGPRRARRCRSPWAISRSGMAIAAGAGSRGGRSSPSGDRRGAPVQSQVAGSSGSTARPSRLMLAVRNSRPRARASRSRPRTPPRPGADRPWWSGWTWVITTAVMAVIGIWHVGQPGLQHPPALRVVPAGVHHEKARVVLNQVTQHVSERDCPGSGREWTRLRWRLSPREETPGPATPRAAACRLPACAGILSRAVVDTRIRRYGSLRAGN